ncbi:MAG: CapA family protein [Candidatus Cryptobacteroides sp.]|jgi:hypothetical protein
MKVIIAGDFVVQARSVNIVQSGQFAQIVPEKLVELLHNVDFPIVNFESPISFPFLKALKKLGPNLSSPREAIHLLQYLGFQSVSLANNHILDYGVEGLRHTVEECKNAGLDFVGAGQNIIDANRVLYVERGNTRLGIINCCEHEFSIATEQSAGANPLDLVRQFRAIQQAKKNADVVIVIVHGGHEYYQLPSIRMQDTYRFFIEAGADAVINHHQHCVSGYEIYKDRPIFYGVGNFYFDWEGKRNSVWNEGMLVELDISTKGVDFRLIPFIQCNDLANITLMTREQEEAFFQHIMRLNHIIVDHDRLSQEFAHYVKETDREYQLALEPYSSRFSQALFRRKMLPSFLNEKRTLKLMNYILCESHRDRLIAFLMNRYNMICNGKDNNSNKTN